MNTLIWFGGIHSLFFAIFHSLFWSKLNWNKQLIKLDDTNNAVMQILNLRIIFVFIFHSFLCLFYTSELLTSNIGKALLVGSSLFWIGRTIEQFWFRKKLPVYHPLSIFLTLLFIIGSVIYLIPLFY